MNFFQVAREANHQTCFASAQHDNGRIEIARCLGVLLLQIIGRDLEGVAVGIAEINRVGNFVILKFEFDSALF